MKKPLFLIKCIAAAAAMFLLPAQSYAEQKTVRACAAEWTANKASLQASGKKRVDFIAECRGISATGTGTPPASTPARETAVVATTDSTGTKTVKACAAEWTASKAALQASGKKRKDFIAECRGITAASAATPDRPASPVTPDKSAPPPQTQRRDTASVQDTGSTIKNPRFSPTAPTGQYAVEAEAKGHCPGEKVVWANTRSKVYHGPKSKRYGTTKRGVYICLKDAAAAGFRAAKKRKKRKAKTVAVASAR